MNKRGKVISKNKHQIKVEFIRSTSCGEKCGGCSKDCSNTTQELILDNINEAELGDQVTVEIDNNFLLKSAFLVYIFPLLMLIVGYYFGNNLNKVLLLPINQEVFSLLTGIVFLSFAFLIVNFFDKKISTKKNLSIN